MRQKFFVLSGILGLIMVVVSCIGYYTAKTNLESSIQSEIGSELENQSNQIEGWLTSKAKISQAAADLMHVWETGASSPEQVRSLLGLVGEDKEVLEIMVGNEEGLSIAYHAGNLQGKLDPRARGWYTSAKSTKKIFFTDVYQDAITGKPVVSIAAPYNDASGRFRGAIVQGITLDILMEKAKEIKYHGEGNSVILDHNGTILASADAGEVKQSIRENEWLKDKSDAILNSRDGNFLIEKNGKENLFAYKTIPSTNWIIGICVPEDVVYAQLNSLRKMYIILTLLGIVLVVAACLQFSQLLTRPIMQLKYHADELAKGNLGVANLRISSRDEIGSLTQAFNSMKENLKQLISKINITAEQVAASSEELTASSHQSAQAATNVAEAVGNVAEGMEKQLESVDVAANSVSRVVQQIETSADRTREIAAVSVKAAEAANQGEKMMTTAISTMMHIESSVETSAKVVAMLGANSKEIGQIVDTIVNISNQTNLLALNAAIEAARAGEHGRGFSVVADEVRKLAEQSQTAAEGIKDRIVKIQVDTENAVVSMQNGSSEVKVGANSIQAVGAQFGEIQQFVNNIRDQLEEVTSLTNQVKDGSKNIASAVNQIKDTTAKTMEHTQTISSSAEEQSASSEEIASASQSLAMLSSEMQKTAQNFKL